MEIFAPIEKSLDGIHFFQENFSKGLCTERTEQ